MLLYMSKFAYTLTPILDAQLGHGRVKFLRLALIGGRGLGAVVAQMPDSKMIMVDMKLKVKQRDIKAQDKKRLAVVLASCQVGAASQVQLRVLKGAWRKAQELQQQHRVKPRRGERIEADESLSGFSFVGV